ncbi:MAG: FecR domain-containing protein, partial [Myxococcales bacterium]|nr:FecR domain-containing protein [Myxococcales bacterium]
MRTGTWAAALAVVVAMGCGGIAETVDETVATISPVRGQATLGDTTSAVVSRARPSDTVRTSERGLTRLSLDQGPQLLLDRATELRVDDGASATLTTGRVFAEAQPGEQVQLTTEHGSVRASDASFSVTIGEGRTEIYVVRGEVSWTHGDDRGIAGSGEELTLADEVERRAAVLWQDWTGGLARPGPATAEGPAGVGLLEARVPDEVGRARWPLVVRRLDVRVRIDRDLAITEVDQLFFNPASETVEGLYRIRVPEGAVLLRFAVDRDDRLVDGYVREKAMARAAYERQVYRGSTEDPALLEWDAPGHYRARIYPIAPGATRKIAVRWASWLERPTADGAALYRLPLSGGDEGPRIQELAFEADLGEAQVTGVRAGLGAEVEGSVVRIRRSDFVPRSDLFLELTRAEAATATAWRAGHVAPPRDPRQGAMPDEDELDYLYVPLRLPDSVFGEMSPGLDLVVVVDVSAGTEPAALELGRSVAESLAVHLGENDRVAVLASDVALRPLDGQDSLGPATHARMDGILDALAREPAGGATDLGAVLARAAALLDPARHGAVVYVGDGAPTVGELGAEALLQQLARLPHPVRAYGVALGADGKLDLLDAITRGGGLAMRVEGRAAAAEAALR